LLAELKASGIQAPLIHSNNSAALAARTETIFNLVGPGCWCMEPCHRANAPTRPRCKKHFQPALSWKCRVSLVKDSAGALR